MNLDVKNWKYFTLGELFEFQKGKRLTKSDMISGKVNFLGAISENNGIRDKIDVPENETWKPNCITVNYNGSVGEAFYQSEPFWASDDVNVLYAKGWEMNRYIALFLCTIIKQERYRFCYGRKWTLEKMQESKIKLPVTSDGFPDWAFMEQFIKSLHHKPITTKITKKPASPDTSKWQRFKISDIFTIQNGKGINAEELEEFSGDFPAVQSGELNNGILGFIDKKYCEEMNYTMTEKSCLTVARTGTAGFVAYQDNGCVVGDSAKILLLKDSDFANKYVYLFLATILNANRYKFSYGRKVTEEKYNDLIVKLPVTETGTPDYNFMENYIKSLPYSDRI